MNGEGRVLMHLLALGAFQLRGENVRVVAFDKS